MSVIQCAACGANNRPQAGYCMRCGKAMSVAECAATRHARAFVERERNGPFFGAFPQALDFSVASLAIMDALITELWGVQGLAPGQRDWQPPPAKMPLVVDFGAYLGEVLCRALPLHWQMDAAHPEVVIAARLIDAQGQRINTFAQMGARFRDGAAVGMASLYTALSGRALPAWRLPSAATVRPVVAAPPPHSVATSPAPAVDIAALSQQATEHLQRGHFGNAVQCLQKVLAAQPSNRPARRDLVLALAQSGAIDEALRQIDEQRKLAPSDVEWADLRALLLLQGGRTDEALGTLDMALLKNPAEPRLLRRRAFALLQGQRYARAQTELAALIAAAPDAELCIGLAQALAQQGQTAAAGEQLTRLLSTPMAGRTAQLDAAARERLASLAPRSAAVVAPAAAPAANSEAAAAAYAAAVEHARNRRFEQALPHFIEAAKLNPKRAAYFKDVGNCLHDLGRSAAAREWFAGCLALDPSYSQARYMLSVVDEKLGHRDAAIAGYRQVLARMDSEQRDIDRAYARLEALGALP